MSGLEGLGAAASVIGVVGVVKTCIDLFDIISSARCAEQSLEDLLVQLQWQRIRFCCWVQETGFTEAIIRQDQVQAPEPPQMLMLLPHEFRLPVILVHIQRTVANMNSRLLAAKPTLDRYFPATTSTSISALWVDKLARILDPTRTRIRALSNTKTYEHTETKLKLWDRLRWVSGDAKEIAQLVDTLRNYNVELAMLLPYSRMARFERRIGRVLVTSPQLAGHVALGSLQESSEGVEEGSDDRQYQRLADLLVRRAREINVDSHAGEADGEGSRWLNRPDASVSQRSLYIRAADFKFKISGGADLNTREYTSYNGRPVMIEWRYYSTKELDGQISRIDSHVHMLAMQLQQLSSLQDTAVLPCLGHFHDEKRHRYALVFRYPDDHSIASPTSLGDRLRSDQPQRIRPDLDYRFRLARSLALTLHQMFCVNWLHKHISSDNILLFEHSADFASLDQPYVCGFGLARRDTKLEVSERLPSVYQDTYRSIEQRLYQHPDRNSDSGPPRYRVEYDVYSLGVLLLEIGLWCSAGRILKDCQTEDLDVVARELKKTYAPELRSRMGKTYADIVLWCLEGSVDGNDIVAPVDDELGNAVDIEEMRRRQFLADYEKRVVCAIENPISL